GSSLPAVTTLTPVARLLLRDRPGHSARASTGQRARTVIPPVAEGTPPPQRSRSDPTGLSVFEWHGFPTNACGISSGTHGLKTRATCLFAGVSCRHLNSSCKTDSRGAKSRHSLVSQSLLTRIRPFGLVCKS